MRHHVRNPILAIGLAAVLVLGAASCSSSDSEGASTSDATSEDADAPTTTAIPAGGAMPELEKLAGKTIGVQTDTTGEAFANENKPEGATVKSFADTDGLFGALQSGEIDAILQDLPVNAYRGAKDKSVKVVETYDTEEQYGIAVEKGNTELLEELNGALADARDDGTYDAV